MGRGRASTARRREAGAARRAPAARRLAHGAALLAVLALGACATYDERVAVAHKQYYTQNVPGAVASLEALVEGAEGDTDELLLKLELATALQAHERYDASSEIFEAVDDRLEVLDYTRAGYEKVAEFAFAPEAAAWRASPPERVMLNTQNMINHLAAGDPGAAAVEARRMRNLVTMPDVDDDELYANRFAWALAGLAFELAGDLGEAAGARREAGATALDPGEPAPGQTLAEGERAATLVVVAQLGKAPVRRESTYLFPAGRTIHRLNLPSLVKRSSLYDTLALELDGVEQGEVPVLFDYGEHVVQRHEDELPTLLAASLFQAFGRALVAEAAARAATRAVDDDDDPNATAGALFVGFLVGLVTNWGLSEAAGTDTRCWSLLPERLGAVRLQVAPGEHELVMRLSGRSTRLLQRSVELAPGEVALVNVVAATYGTWTPTPAPTPRDLAGSPALEETLRLLEGAAWWVHVLD